MSEIIKEDGKHICPKCGSKRISLHEQCVLYKVLDANSEKLLNPITLKSRMSNREKAREYDRALTEGVGGLKR